MLTINLLKSGIIVGFFVGFWHFLWSLLVGIGIAQALLDWIYGLHFLNNPFQVSPFNLLTAIFLIIVTSIIGFIGGYFFAFLWNKFARTLF